MKPLVSIHIITYNQIKFIHETLTSAIEQNYDNLEVIVADDGSTDGTAEVILEFAEKFPNIMIPLVGGPNLGITANCNRGLKACKGKYIAFQGGDDILLPEKIFRQVEWMEKDEKRVLCGHQVQVFYEGSTKTHLMPRYLKKGQGPEEFIKRGTLFCGTSVMVRSNNMPIHGFNEEMTMVSDGLFWIECLLNGGKFGYIPGIYAKYRKHSNNFTNDKIKAINDLEKEFEIIEEKYPLYKRECKQGRANLVEYGRALFYLMNNEYRKAYYNFLKSFFYNPLNYKAFFRIIQTVLYAIKKRIIRW